MKRGAASRQQHARPSVDEGIPHRSPHLCCAHGCPLPGTMSASTMGGSAWLCRHHYGAASKDWSSITTAITRERALAAMTGET